MAPDSAGRRLLAGLLVALVVAALAVWTRDVDGQRRPWPEGAPRPEGAPAAYTLEPDGHYHMRRVDRFLDEGVVAGTDPYLSHPDGAVIPWPPYYDRLLGEVAALAGPPAEEDAARRRRVEHLVGAAPLLFGVLTSLVAALAGARLAGWRGGLVAGAYHALCFGSINYSVAGNGDHHAWISLLNALVLLGATEALRAPSLARPWRSAALGAVLGVLVGLQIGSWVAALVHLLLLQLVLGWMLVVRGRERLPGLAPLGLALHAAAAATLWPAVASSPWKDELPWMVVNLSWFHLAFLGLSALVFVPPLVVPALRGGSRGARAYPWAALAALVALAAVLFALGAGPARGVQEGFAWASRTDRFMAVVQESWGLLDARGGGWSDLHLALGYGAWLAPLAWWLAAREAFARGRHELLPWVVALPPMLLQAFQQRRFSDALAPVLAVVLGAGAARLVSTWRPAARLPAWALALLLGGAVGAAQAPAVARTLRLRAATPVDWHLDARFGQRLLLEWLRTEGPPGAVLANWDLGHGLEWVADRPTVATNFGSYVGPEAFRTPAEFFLATDEAAAEALLVERGVDTVLVTSALPRQVRSQAFALGQATPEPWLTADGAAFQEAWFRTLGARLLAGGVATLPDGRTGGESLRFLRLLHVSPVADPGARSPHSGQRGLPCGTVWRRVAGARLVAEGEPGETLRVELRLSWLDGAFTVRWFGSAPVGADGRARLRVPYATTRNGDGRVDAAAWSVGDERGALTIPDWAVRHGAEVEVF